MITLRWGVYQKKYGKSERGIDRAYQNQTAHVQACKNGRKHGDVVNFFQHLMDDGVGNDAV